MTINPIDKPEPLQRELAYYARNKKSFLRHHEGKFVVILGEKFGGAFDTAGTAYSEGIRQFEAEQFLVKQVLRTEPVFVNHALSNGLIWANGSTAKLAL